MGEIANKYEKRRRQKRKKAFWTKQFYLWHWVSSAICLSAMILFAFTGITLNHAADIKAEPKITTISKKIPPHFLSHIAPEETDTTERQAILPTPLAVWLEKETGASLRQKKAEWSEFEIYLSLPRPGGDAWLALDRETGEMNYELTKRGAISYLNDLHKGRNTGAAWSWFLDIFSVATLVFCLTGLALLIIHAKRRPSTWPVVATGILLPLLLILIFIH